MKKSRKSIRLPHYDYAQNGYYFVTICTSSSQNLFGTITDHQMQLNSGGNLIAKWYLELQNKFPCIRTRKYVIMPNHFHCIIEIVGADLSVCRRHPTEEKTGEHKGSPLPEIIQWFKTMTTNDYIRGVKNGILPPFNKTVWQRGYFEHIIRNEKTYLKIYEYIENNPAKWMDDKYYTR